MPISTGWSSSSLISDVLPEEEDELLVNENEKLRHRVGELEKIVVMQRNEIMLLQASTADILRRVNILESHQSPNYNSLPRTSGMMSSRSSYTVSRSPTVISRRQKSPITKPVYGGLNNNGHEPPTEHRSRPADMVNISIGKSARGSPMRKWISTNEIKESPCAADRLRRISSSSEASTSVISNCVRRMNIRTPRSCNYKKFDTYLPIFVNGKTVQVPVPTKYEQIDPTIEQEPPDLKINLKHVYSYRGKDVRENIDILPTGELIFFSANLVILMDLNEEEMSQRIYQEHTCDVKCVTVHPNKVIIASGQSSCHSAEKNVRVEHRKPVESPDELVRQLETEHTEAHVRIWDSVKLTTLYLLGGFEAGFEKGVSQLSFSSFDAGIHLACVDESTKHVLSVWNWQKRKKVAEVKAANDVVFDCKWHPTIKNLLVLYGKGHFSFFTMDSSNGVLIKSAATFEGRDKPKTVLSMCFAATTGYVITGDSNGTISLWDPKTYKTVKQAHGVHPGGVYALTFGKSGKLLSGGKDRMICEWELEDLVRCRRPVELPDERGFARVIVHNSNSIIVGTSTNSLLKIPIDSSNQSITSLIEGDAGELSEMIVNSSSIITCSQCGTIRKWSIGERKVEWSKKFLNGVECIDVDATNTYLIAGFTHGSWQIINMSILETLKEHREGDSAVSAVKFAPNGGMFAVCTKEPMATLYRIDGSRNLVKLSRIQHVPSTIIEIDWSSDSQQIRAQTSASHLLFWSKNGEILDGSSVRDVIWDRSRCRIGFETALVAHSTNGKICSIDKSENLVAVGLEDGTVRVYQNPVKSVIAGCVELFGHGKFAKGVGFASASQLFSSSSDNSIFEWDVS